MVVEDNAAVRRTVARRLIQLGYHVTEAESADGALALLERNERVDLVFTDVMMVDKVNGFELARIVHPPP
jgi:CheY-like chemotaxis protein